ncbi:MAG: prolipoprotein diacylglyceryl transferase [Bacteroidota bacterium]|nr:prolipoprotein diacylglyceryl transferase [Bacteroidota bacterium]
MDFLFITWDISPEIFSIGPISIRYYGVLFASGFIIGQYLMTWFFKMEKRSLDHLEQLLIWMVLSTIIGARLGHCLFYEPEYYLSQPWKILFVWEGGLASHGATVAMLLGVYLFSRKYPEFSWFYLLDRLVITVALGAGFIRLGNLMNSEIVGKPTDVPWGFIFRQNLTPEGFPEDFARHPSQLYEAIFYFALFVFLLFMYLQMKEKTPNGRIFGWLVVLIFTQRFLIEYTKENQVAFESSLPLNMGQMLSIPLIVFGGYVLYRSYTKPLTI